jgi:formate hydrogenlyase subunit 3/multisubunit Na+/H+ antiporter MnhD subunit
VTAGASLLVAAIGWPVVLALAFAVTPLRRTAALLLPTMALPALLLAFTGDAAVLLAAPGLFTSMRLGLDGIGRPFLILTALLWSVVGWHAVAYMRGEPRFVPFAGFMIATGLGNLGLVLAQDALSFYLFFALMTFAAFGLVVHSRTPEARRAGRVYIVMAILGEAMILAGLFAIAALATDASFERVPEAYQALSRPGTVAALLFFGFGVKAGLIPLHLWLPLAHPVAPTPASALLSGAMIKAGVLGWLRFLPLGVQEFPVLGATAMVLGVSATLLAVAIGITQRDVKTVLAYSSISQMGFLTVGVGAALAMPAAAPLLILAVAVYAIHHAIAKAALFLGVSAVHGTRPRWRFAAAALPGLVLAGAPLTSGAVAKVALKDALGDVPPPGALPVDTLLTFAAVGTALLMARYLALLALARQARDSHGPVNHGITLPWLALVVLSAAAAVWLPVTLAPLGELPLATAPGYIAAALWPLALAAIIGFMALLLARRYPGLTAKTVPAGDIVAGVEVLAAYARRTAAAAPRIDASRRIGQGVRQVGRRAGHIIDDSAAALERVSTGPALGIIFVVMALLLFTALR